MYSNTWYISGPEPVRIEQDTPANNDNYKNMYMKAYRTEINTANIKERPSGNNGVINNVRGTDDDWENRKKLQEDNYNYIRKVARMKDRMYILDNLRLNFSQQMRAGMDDNIIDLREIPVDPDSYDYDNPARVRAPALVISGLNQRQQTKQYNKYHQKEAVLIPDDIEAYEDDGEIIIQ